jgi:large subunit ribosomal protein L21
MATMPIRRVTAPLSMTYAIVKLGGKQYRVQEGERLLVDRLAVDENKTFHPEVLFVGGDGQAELAPKGVQVTVKVLGHERGEKIRIGKYKKRTGYRRHNGFRASISRVQIESIGKKATRAAAAPKAEPARETPKAAPTTEPKPGAKTTAAASAKKPATRRTRTTKAE